MVEATGFEPALRVWQTRLLPTTTRPQHGSEVTQLATHEISKWCYLWIKTILESKRDLEFNQVPITTKPEVQINYGIGTWLLAVTII